MSRQIAQPSAHYELAPDEALALAAGNLALPPYRVRSARFQRPLTLSLSPSEGERVAFRPGEGNTCVTSAWWWCRVAPARRSPSRRGRRRKFAFAPGRRSEVRTAVTPACAAVAS